MHTLERLPICMLLMLSLVGCQQETTEISSLKVKTPIVQVATKPVGGSGTKEPYIFKTSEADMVTLRGVLLVLDPFSMLPDPNDAIFLVPLTLEGAGPGKIPAFSVGEVPQAEVDERTGEFVFTNIQPGHYAVVVIVQGGSQVPVHKYQSSNLAIIKIEDKDIGSTIDVGYLSLP
jgi:hypothetical protein